MFREGTGAQHERAQKYCSILILPRKIGGMQKHYSRLSLTGETAEDWREDKLACIDWCNKWH